MTAPGGAIVPVAKIIKGAKFRDREKLIERAA
jgi:hypothetical protein